MAKKSTMNAPSTAPTRASSRVTRSVSVEPANTAPVAAEDNITVGATGRQRRGRLAKTAPPIEEDVIDPEIQNELSTVEEDAVIEDGALAEEDEPSYATAVGDQTELEVKDDIEERRTSHLSAATGISGTTAKTSFSQEEADELNAKDILDDLPDLVSAAKKFAGFLLPDGPETSIDTWKAMDPKRYNKHVNVIKDHKQSFGTQAYVSPRTVSRALFGTPVIDQPALRPNDVIYQVNLVEMLHDLVRCKVSDWTANYDTLQRLDTTFPVAIANDVFTKADLVYWCKIATQLVIARLDVSMQRGHDFTPTKVIHDVFYDADNNFKHEEPFAIPYATSAQKTAGFAVVNNCCRTLQKTFIRYDSKDGAPAGVSELKAQFGWLTFVEDALAYYQARAIQLDQLIQSSESGGVEGLIGRISGIIKKREALARMDHLKQDILAKKGTPRKNFLNSIDTLKQLATQVDQRPAAPVAQMMAPVANMQQASAFPPNPYDPQIIGDDAEQEHYGQAERAVNAVAKKRSLLDPQADAQRINWDDPSQPPYRPREIVHAGADPITLPSSSATARAGTKRSAPLDDDGAIDDPHDQDFVPTQDDGFQSDDREHLHANKRRKELATSSATGPPYSSTPYDHALGTQNDQSPASARAGKLPSRKRPSAAARPRKNPGSSIPVPAQTQEALATQEGADPDAPPLTQYERLKIIAKHNRRPKPPQVRRAWTVDEEEKLNELIVEYGTGGISWSTLKSLDNESEEKILAGRDAEAMRFKARNMKVTMLLANQTCLGQNWEHVVLDRKAMVKLEAAGIPYHQDPIRARATED